MGTKARDFERMVEEYFDAPVGFEHELRMKLSDWIIENRYSVVDALTLLDESEARGGSSRDNGSGRNPPLPSSVS